MESEHPNVVLIGLGAYAIHSTLLLGGAWFIEQCWRKAPPALLGAIWRTALVASLATAALQVSGLVDPLAGRVPVPFAGETGEHGQSSGIRAAISLQDAKLDASGTARERRPATSSDPVGAAAKQPDPSGNINWSIFALSTWGLGILLLAARHVRSLIAMQTLLSGRTPVRGGPLYDRLQALSRRAGLKRAPLLSASDRIDSPFTLVGGEICIPAWTQASLPDDQMGAMLAHEVAHVCNRDPAWLAIGAVLETVFFFQPLNRLARRRIDHNAELCADDWAATQTGDGRSLARCLSCFASIVERRKAPVFASAMATSKSPLVERVERLVSGRHTTGVCSTRTILLAGLSALALGAVMPGVIAHGQNAPSREVSIRSDGGDNTLSARIVSKDFELGATGKGAFLLGEDGVSIAGVSSGGHLDIAYSRGGLHRRVRLEGVDGAMTRQYWQNGETRAWTSQSDDFLAEVMPVLFRETGLMADQRIAWLLANQGHEGVVDEIGRIGSDAIQGKYAVAYSEATPVPDAVLIRLLKTIGRDISSDSGLRAALAAIYRTQRPAGRPLVALLDAANTIESDAETCSLLAAVSGSALAWDDAITVYLDLSRAIQSDSEMRRALLHLFAREDLDAGRAEQALALAAERVASDSELGSLLRHVAGQAPEDDAIARALIRTTRAIDSSSERARTLGAIAHQATLSFAAWEDFFASAVAISSDSEKSRLLVAVAPNMPDQPDVAAAYRRALGSIRSDSAYRQAARAIEPAS